MTDKGMTRRAALTGASAAGSLLATYHMNDRVDVKGGVRHIACTVFTP